MFKKFICITKKGNISLPPNSQHVHLSTKITLKDQKNRCEVAQVHFTPKKIVRDRAGVARWAHNPKVGCSNHPPATEADFSSK
jgi:hypothetical protein